MFSFRNGLRRSLERKSCAPALIEFFFAAITSRDSGPWPPKNFQSEELDTPKIKVIKSNNQNMAKNRSNAAAARPKTGKKTVGRKEGVRKDKRQKMKDEELREKLDVSLKDMFSTRETKRETAEKQKTIIQAEKKSNNDLLLEQLQNIEKFQM
jgi:hypothetical protein